MPSPVAKPGRLKMFLGFRLNSHIWKSVLGMRTEMPLLPLEESGLPCCGQGIPLCWALPPVSELLGGGGRVALM